MHTLIKNILKRGYYLNPYIKDFAAILVCISLATFLLRSSRFIKIKPLWFAVLQYIHSGLKMENILIKKLLDECKMSNFICLLSTYLSSNCTISTQLFYISNYRAIFDTRDNVHVLKGYIKNCCSVVTLLINTF